MKISACLITHNEEKNIGEWLSDIQGVADEIIILDSFSQDKTREIAVQFGAKVVEKEFTNFADYRNQGIALASNEWILSIDADERCSPQLIAQIPTLIKDTQHDAFKFYWKNYCDLKLVKTLWKTALFRNYGRYVGEVHEHTTNLKSKFEVTDPEVFILHRKSKQEQLAHLTHYRSIIIDLSKNNKVPERIQELIQDHNENVESWLGNDYEYLKLTESSLS